MACSLGGQLDANLPAQPCFEGKAQNHVTFLLNFFGELRRKVPAGKSRPPPT